MALTLNYLPVFRNITVIDCPMDDAKNRRSVRTETRAGNPACLNQARGALDSIRKLLGLDAPAQVKIEEEEEGPINLEDLTDDDLNQKSDAELRALIAQCDVELAAANALQRRGEEESAGLHDVHQAGLPDELAGQVSGFRDQVSGADGPGQVSGGGGPLPGVAPQPESGTAAYRLLPH